MHTHDFLKRAAAQENVAHFSTRVGDKLSHQATIFSWPELHSAPVNPFTHINPIVCAARIFQGGLNPRLAAFQLFFHQAPPVNAARDQIFVEPSCAAVQT